MRGRHGNERQGLLFPDLEAGPGVDLGTTDETQPGGEEHAGRWQMPERQGRTVAQVRLRWARRLSRGQMARVEQELGTLPAAMSKLGFGRVYLDRVFVRRRRGD